MTKTGFFRVVLSREGGLRPRHLLRCYDLAGREVWVRRLSHPKVVASDSARVYVAEANRVVALDLATGSLLWKTLVGTFGNDVLLSDGETLYCFGLGDHSTMAVGPRGVSGHLTALNGATGARHWQHRFVPGLREVRLDGLRLSATQYMGAGQGYRELEIDRKTGRGVCERFELADGAMVEIPTPGRRTRRRVA
jgi:outer membrane protein assembly factor BamB